LGSGVGIFGSWAGEDTVEPKTKRIARTLGAKFLSDRLILCSFCLRKDIAGHLDALSS
jgi:hypothetical protein